MGVLRFAPPVSVSLWDVHHNFWNEHHSHHQTTSGVITKMRNADFSFSSHQPRGMDCHVQYRSRVRVCSAHPILNFPGYNRSMGTLNRQ